MKDQNKKKSELIEELGRLRERIGDRERSKKKTPREENIRKAFAELGRKLSAVSSPKQAAMVIFDIADELFGWDACYLIIYSEKEDKLYSVVDIDTIDGERREVSSMVNQPETEASIRDTLTLGPRIILRQDTSQLDNYKLFPFGNLSRKSSSLMFVPISKWAKNIGRVSIQSYTPNAYNSSDLELLQVLTDHCSGAIERILAEENLKKFKMAVEQTATSLIICDRKQNIEYVNREFEKMTGYTCEEVIGKGGVIWKSDKHDERFYQGILDTITSGNVYNGVCISSKKNGTYFYEEITITPLKDAQGDVTHFVKTGKDITERILAEEALRKTREELEGRVEERTRELSRSNALLKREVNERKRAENNLENSLSMLRATLESTTDGILVVNKKGRIVDFNRKFIQMWRVPDYLIEKRNFGELNMFMLDHLSYVERPAADLYDLSERADIESFDIVELIDGRILERSSRPQWIGEKSVGRVWSFRDVTKPKQAEEALARSEAVYREAIENAAGVPYRLIYKDERYDFIGEGITSLLGYAPDEFCVSALRSMILETRIADPDAPSDHVEYVEAFKRGEVDQYRVDLLVKTPGHEEKWVSDCSVPVRDEKSGKVIGSLGILQDITKRKRMEEQARHQQEKLVQAEKLVALGVLVSGVAHEINNPNNFIMLNTPILLEAWKNIIPILDEYYDHNGDFLMGGVYYSKMRQHVPELFSCILAGANRIKNIVHELRDFARESRAEQMDMVDVNAIVRSSLTLLENMIKKSTDHFSVEYDPDLPKIKGNFQRLEQVVINLIQNACQALNDKDQGLFVSTGFNHAEGAVIIQIRDEGGGIPTEIHKYILDPFFTTKRDSGGVGLGLSISSRIVNEHKGFLKLSSLPGKGTKATIAIPVDHSHDISEGVGL